MGSRNTGRQQGELSAEEKVGGQGRKGGQPLKYTGQVSMGMLPGQLHPLQLEGT